MATLKLPITFASGTFIDGDGRTILPQAVISRLNLHDDLVRGAAFLLSCCDDASSLGIEDVQNTLRAAEVIRRT